MLLLYVYVSVCVFVCVMGERKKLRYLDFDLIKTSWSKMGANLSERKYLFCGVLALIHKTVSEKVN